MRQYDASDSPPFQQQKIHQTCVTLNFGDLYTVCLLSMPACVCLPVNVQTAENYSHISSGQLNQHIISIIMETWSATYIV